MYWKIASLLMFAIFCGWSYIEVKVKMRKEQQREDSFWEREAKANSVRRKPIEHLDYIHIPDDSELPLSFLTDNQEMPNIIKTLNELRKDKVLNLTGYSNTELKLKFGAPNLTELSKYDQNFTALVTTFQKWADLLMEAGYDAEADKLMEFLVSIEADIGRTYRNLGVHYLKKGEVEKFDSLISSAEKLRSMNKPYIVASLKELKNDFQA